MTLAVRAFRRLVFGLALVSIAFASTGCAYRSAALPVFDSDQNVSTDESVVAVGSTVSVILLSGDSVGGKNLYITDEDIVLGNRGNYRHENVTIKVAEVDWIGVREPSDGIIEAVWFVGILVGLGTLIYNSIDGPN